MGGYWLDSNNHHLIPSKKNQHHVYPKASAKSNNMHHYISPKPQVIARANHHYIYSELTKWHCWHGHMLGLKPSLLESNILLESKTFKIIQERKGRDREHNLSERLYYGHMCFVVVEVDNICIDRWICKSLLVKMVCCCSKSA